MADKKQKIVDKKQVPIGVKLISVWHYIGAAFNVIVGILFFILTGMSDSIAKQIPIFSLLGAFFVIFGIIFIGLGILDFFVARGLWRARQWARIAAIILACLGIFGAIIQMLGVVVVGILGFIINLVIGGYLIFSKDVKKAFD